MSLWENIFGNKRRALAVERLRERLGRFRDLVEKNNKVLELIADAGEKLGGEYIFDFQYLKTLDRQLAAAVRATVSNLNAITADRHPELMAAFEAIERDIQAILESRIVAHETELVFPLDRVGEDLFEATGEKMARLGEMRKRLDCCVPDGFVISAYACRRFLDGLGIEGLLQAAEAASGGDQEQQLADRAAEIQKRILQADLPRDLSRAIRSAVSALKKRSSCERLAVRSSALGEDGEHSFAGQYRTVLGVEPDGVGAAYREVLASLFSVEVMRYRQSIGLPRTEGLMAVGCLRQIDAKASGVLYTLDPTAPERSVMVGAAAFGLGRTVVDGSGPTDRFVLSRESPHRVVSMDAATKPEAQVVSSDGRVRQEPVAADEQALPAIGSEQLSDLATVALRIERFMKCAQDIEWAVDQDGRLFVLQARPLHLAPALVPDQRDMTGVIDQHTAIMKDRGNVACRGIGAGQVYVVKGDEDLDGLPRDVVLVARTSSPRLASVLARANAVLTDIGTATGHLAAIAREFRVPTIVDMEVATEVLAGAGEVTVDAEENVIYQGRVDALLHHQLLRSASYEDTREFRVLRRMLRKVAPLNLKDPNSSSFAVKNCRTYHDIIRFAHEKAVEELTSGQALNPNSAGPYVRRLELQVPLDLIAIDLGGGLAPDADTGPVGVEHIRSEPLRALLDGLHADGVWETEPADMDLDGFMSSATRSATLAGPLALRPQQNLAIISDRYLNLILRLGYHFNIVDCYMSEARNDNFIYFRFAGGVTEQARRSRRAKLLRKILEQYDFVVDGRGDLVIGRIKKISRESMIAHLEMIGRLIGFSRQLDIFLRSDKLIDHYAKSFLEGAPASGKIEKEGSMSNRGEVLVLDDESMVCERLKEHLEKADFTVETFTESPKAIERLDQKTFDVVITDLKMKGPTGLDVLHHIRRSESGTEVILITGYGTLEVAREAEYSGVHAFVHKPFTLEEITSLAKKAAKKARKRKGKAK